MKPYLTAVPPALALLPVAADANTLYKCTDDSGVVLFTNQKPARRDCVVLSHQAQGTVSGAPRQKASTPTPADFPRVSGSEQKARDNDRRAILDKELANELQGLETAKKSLLDAGSQPADKLQPLRDAVALHERNVEALKKELGNLR